MAVHDKFAATAQRLITRHGRVMTFSKLSRTPGTPTKQWRGPSDAPASGYEFQIPATAVVVDYNEEEIDGDQVRRGDKRLLVAAMPHAGVDLLRADTVLDGAGIYGIIKGSLLKPGTTEILYEFQIRQ